MLISALRHSLIKTISSMPAVMKSLDSPGVAGAGEAVGAVPDSVKVI